MNSNIPSTLAAKTPLPIEQQQHAAATSAKASVIFSFGNNVGPTKAASTTEMHFFKSPITTTATGTTTPTTNGQPLFSAHDHWAKSDYPKAFFPPEKTSRSLVASRETKTNRKVRTIWSTAEDELLKQCVVGQLDWEQIDWSEASKMVNGRNHKQCRDRWHNYLRPGLVKGHWTMEEEEVIKEMHRIFGPKWCTMAKLMKNRAENDIKNKWYSMVRKEQRLQNKSPMSNGLFETKDPPIEPFSFDYQAFPPMPELAIGTMVDSVEEELDITEYLPHPDQHLQI